MNSSTIRSSLSSLTSARTCLGRRTRARATRPPARLKPSISFLLRSTTMGESHRSTSHQHWSCRGSWSWRQGLDEACAAAPGPVSETLFLGLAHLGEHGASRNEGSLVEGEGMDYSCVGRGDWLFHFHRLQDEEELSLLDLLALFDEHLHDRTRHRSRQAGGGIGSGPWLVDGRRLGLTEHMGFSSEGDEDLCVAK